MPTADRYLGLVTPGNRDGFSSHVLTDVGFAREGLGLKKQQQQGKEEECTFCFELKEGVLFP